MSRIVFRTLIAAGAVTGLVVGGAVAPSEEASAEPPAGPSYSLLYEDEFDGTSLDADDWYYRETSNYDVVHAYMRRQNVSVSDGALHLAFTRQDVTGDGTADLVGGGVISTQLFGYGYYEIRAKLFNGTQGLHTSFWSMGLNTGMAGANGDPRIEADITASKLAENNQLYEIDGFEHNSPNSLDFGDVAWTNGAGNGNSRKGYQPGSTYGVDYGQWNVYGYEYTPTEVIYTLNGVERFRHAVGAAGKPFNPMNFWLTALPYKVYPDATKLPGTSDIDYFRFYGTTRPDVNLLGNGSFDVLPKSNPGAWIVPAWIEGYDKPASKRVTTSSHDGARSLEHSGTTAYLVTTKQNLTHIPNGTYDLTAWVRSSGGQTQAALRVLNYGGTELTYNVPATSVWTQVTIPNVLVGTNSATIAITSNADAGEWLQVDQVSFDAD
jgi:hypothetical protein